MRTARLGTLLATAVAAVCSCSNTNNNAAPGTLGSAGSSGSAPVDGGAGGSAAGAGGTAAAPEKGYLWFAGAALSAFTNSQTKASSNDGPRYVFVPSFSVTSFHDLAFDADGNLWAIPTSGNQIIRLPAAQLINGAPPIPDAIVTSAALQSPESLTFDAAGNLWVMNYDGSGSSVASIVRFADPRASFGSATLTAAATIGAGTDATAALRFREGTTIAFDAAGNLWFAGISNVMRIEHPTALQGNVTAAPAAVLTTTDAFASIAFDTTGALWITGAGGGYYVVRIANPGAISGTVAAAPAAKVHLPTGTALFAGGMAFDADGALWIAMSNQLVKLPSPGALAGDVSPTPAVVLGLQGLPDLTSKLVIRPQPAGLPVH